MIIADVNLTWEVLALILIFFVGCIISILAIFILFVIEHFNPEKDLSKPISYVSFLLSFLSLIGFVEQSINNNDSRNLVIPYLVIFVISTLLGLRRWKSSKMK